MVKNNFRAMLFNCLSVLSLHHKIKNRFMRTFILKKDLPDLKAGAKFTQKYDAYECVAEQGGVCYYFHQEKVEGNTEWFEEEQQLMTEDGFKINKNSYVFIVYPDLTEDSGTYENFYTIKNTNHKVFFRKDSAEKYIYDNRPIFSRKQISDLSIDVYHTHTATKFSEVLVEVVKAIERKLGI